MLSGKFKTEVLNSHGIFFCVEAAVCDQTQEDRTWEKAFLWGVGVGLVEFALWVHFFF